MDTRIWKEIADGIRISPFSVLNVINLESDGSTVPREASKAFQCIGKVLNTSRSNIAVGVWAKSSMMYVAYSSSIHGIVGNLLYGGA